MDALRLITRARVSRPPALPLGARRWSADAVDAAVLLDASGGSTAGAAAVAAQIPPAASLPAGTTMLVLGVALRGDALWRRLLRRRYVRVPRSPLCGALVARGFVEVAAATDAANRADVAWGKVP